MSGAPGDPRVGFLVAGVQKAGTSSLFRYLRGLPGLQLPIKEPHFFDDETIGWATPDYRPYHAHFADDGRLRGEATPIYLYWPNALERIARYNPAMKLILVFRDPVERAWSHWKMEYVREKEAGSFAWCIREGRARLATAAPYPAFHRTFSYVERGFYGRQLARALDLFPRDQLLLLRAADLAENPDRVIAQAARFLAVPPPSQPIIPVRALATVPADYGVAPTAADIALLDGLYAEEMERYRSLDGPWPLPRDAAALALPER